MSQGRFNALLIDPDQAARGRLRTAMDSVLKIGQVEFTQYISDALQKLARGAAFDVIFISNRLPDPEISEFIKCAKEVRAGGDAAFVLVLKTDKQDEATVAKRVIDGGDGFLFEPYSAENVSEAALLAAKVKKERTFEREKAAVTTLVGDIIPQLDQLAYFKSCDMSTTRSLNKLVDLCAPIKQLTSELIEFYLNEAVKQFRFAPLPKHLSKFKKYEGVSSRIKKRLAKKVEADLGNKGGK